MMGYYSFSSFGFAPGQMITLAEVGSYSRTPTVGVQFTDLVAVFSATNILLDPSAANRVPGAIRSDTKPYGTPPTAIGGQITDIPDDFMINNFGPSGTSIALTIPTAAAFLFFSNADVFFSDNTTPFGPFGVNITSASVPEPSSLAMCGIACVVGMAVARARRNRAA